MANVAMAFVAIAAGAWILFLTGPGLMGIPSGYAGHRTVDASGWDPLAGVDFTDTDSIMKIGGSPALSIRYDSHAPRTLELSMTRVMADGSELRDTIDIALRDVYGKSLGRHGYEISEIKHQFGWRPEDGQCRLLEFAPTKKTPGIVTVGLIVYPI